MTVSEPVKNLIVDTISSYQDEILDFTKALVRIPTENPPGTSYLACVELMASKLREIGFDSTLVEVPDVREGKLGAPHRAEVPGSRYCLLSFYGEGKRTLYFHGHYDVVPASSPAQFRPYVNEGRLYGRGSADMKGGIAAMIYAVKAIQDCARRDRGLEIQGRIGLTIVPDEETGGPFGARYLVDTGMLGQGGIGMFTPEPTSGVVWNASRGAVSMRVTVKGKSAHVALQHQGINAFERMLLVANALRELKIDVESKRTNFKIRPQAARHSILLMGGRCEGGTNFNAVPGECSFTVDRRINPEEDLELEKRRLLALFERLREDGIELEVEILQEGESTGVSEDDPVARVLAASVEAITGKSAPFEMCPGFLETRYYAQRGVPAFGYGPGLLSVSHGPDEFVRLTDLYDCAAIYALSAAQLLGPQ